MQCSNANCPEPTPQNRCVWQARQGRQAGAWWCVWVGRYGMGNSGMVYKRRVVAGGGVGQWAGTGVGRREEGRWQASSGGSEAGGRCVEGRCGARKVGVVAGKGRG